MSGMSRRAVLRGVGGGLAAAVTAVPEAAVAVGGRSAGPVFTFASLPDFFNGDVADLRVLPSWDGGPNSVNKYWLDAIDHCLGAVAAHSPDAVFVAGDAVEGRWNIDSDGRQLFGRPRVVGCKFERVRCRLDGASPVTRDCQDA